MTEFHKGLVTHSAKLGSRVISTKVLRISRMPVQSLTLDQAAEMSIATVRLWDVQQAIPQAKYFRFSDQEFSDWKANTDSMKSSEKISIRHQKV